MLLALPWCFVDARGRHALQCLRHVSAMLQAVVLPWCGFLLLCSGLDVIYLLGNGHMLVGSGLRCWS